VKPDIRLLAIDIDGTLLSSKFKISPRDMAALRRVQSLGTEIILCTGRRHTFAMPIANLLGFDLWLCSSNGALTRSTLGETFQLDHLPAETAKRFCEYMADFRRGMVLTFDKEIRGALVIEHENWLAESVSRWIDTNARWIEYATPIESALTEDPIQAMICGPLDMMREAEAAVGCFPGKHEITLLKTEYPHRDLSILDVLNRDCSKGHAVERWAKHRGLTREQVMAIGDNYNDIEMLQFSGVSVVMGNAPNEMKQHGWMETRSNDESGIAYALEEVFGRKVLDLDLIAQPE